MSKHSKRLAVLALLTVSSMALGCDPAPNPIERMQLVRSRESWVTIKGPANRHYRYVDRASSFSGVTWETTIEVQADQVLSRAFAMRDGNGIALDSWTETGIAVGTHDDGAPALTMEGVYDGCESTVLGKDPDQYLITLGFRPDGVLAVCVYAQKGCLDDCATGYRISSLDLLD